MTFQRNEFHCKSHLAPEVALVVGSGQVELFSPEEKCEIVLAPIPQTTEVHRPPLAFIEGNIYTCGVLNLGM
jgi:hypothetical protein